MEIGYAKAETGRRLESTGGGVHSNCGGGEGVVGWKGQCSPKLSIFIRCFRRPCEDIVPSVAV